MSSRNFGTTEEVQMPGKKTEGQSKQKPKKLRLNKDTLKDLSAKSADRVEGGIPKSTRWTYAGCCE